MTNDSKIIRTWVQVFVTIIFGAFSIFIIWNEPANSDKLKWAFGIVGIIIGYWSK